MTDRPVSLRPDTADCVAIAAFQNAKQSRVRRSRSTCLLALLTLAFAFQPHIRAEEPLFGFSCTTDLLPKGKFELEQASVMSIIRIFQGHYGYGVQGRSTQPQTLNPSHFRRKCLLRLSCNKKYNGGTR